MNPPFPPLPRRYLSSLIDGLLLLFFVVVSTIALQGDEANIVAIRVTLVFLVLFTYEPILESTLCTLGQLVTGIRVRRYEDHHKRLPLGRAYLRLFLKVLLGAYSFLAIGFNKQRRAVHDFAARSIVLEKEAVNT